MFMELLPGGELFEHIPVGIGLHIQQMFIYYSQVSPSFSPSSLFSLSNVRQYSFVDVHNDKGGLEELLAHLSVGQPVIICPVAVSSRLTGDGTDWRHLSTNYQANYRYCTWPLHCFVHFLWGMQYWSWIAQGIK